MICALALVCILNNRCTPDELEPMPPAPETEQIYGINLPSTAIEPGNLRIYVSHDLADSLEAHTDSLGQVKHTQIAALHEFQQQVSIISMSRLFPHAGQFEERTRARGLHRWYSVQFNPKNPAPMAARRLNQTPGINIIELVPKIKRPTYTITETMQAVDNQTVTRNSSNSLPFNDELLDKQWHYRNDGSRSGMRQGSDIHVVPVWQAGITGNKNVVVSVVDGGVDFRHEDLHDNMWRNPERNGDEVYGYNFVKNSWIIHPESHGTHVAGTIAAINNNGKGVCGIAGGNKAKGVPGVRLMSCQIFEGEQSARGATAIKWGADHGAVISQNSWGYIDPVATVPASDKDAIDYFVDFAGCDNHGAQLPNSPMKGGVVIFAAGNDNRETDCYPAQYEKAVAVASIGADFQRAYYSNYGKWVDISAPGGDASKGFEVLSTLPNNKYGRMQGTSMACPHVSGVAALVVSKFGGKGFTNTACLERMMLIPTDITHFNNKHMGKGLINATAALLSGVGQPPDPITDLSASTNSNFVTFSLTVPADPDTKQATAIKIYYSKQKITQSNYKSLNNVFFEISSKQEGETYTNTFGDLDFGTNYFIAASAFDLTFNESNTISNVVQITTGSNSTPIVTPNSPIELTVKKHQNLKMALAMVADPDGHSLSATIEPPIEGITPSISHNDKADSLALQINAVVTPTGTNKTTVIVSDKFGAKVEIPLTINILPNHPPQVAKKMQNLVFGSNNDTKMNIDTKQFFSDPDDEPLTFTYTIQNRKTVQVEIENEHVAIKPKNYGQAQITLIAIDAMDERVEQTFDVLVRDGTYAADLFPNPVIDTLNIRTGTKTNAKLKIVAANGINIFDQELEIGPFDPVKINMKPFAAGTYTAWLKFEQNGEQQEVKYNFVKL